jgi:hypothetical protein
VPVGTTVQLDVSGSVDVDGDLLTYTWALTARPAGSAAELSDPAALQPTFVVDRPGTYAAQLIVFDGSVDSAPATTMISTVNSPPAADAGPDRAVRVGATATLDGSGSTDADGDLLTHRWTVTSRPPGSTAELVSGDIPQPMLAIDRADVYTAQLIVSDGLATSAPDTVMVTTENVRPVADAGPDQTAGVGELVVLDGTASSDADGDPLTYTWALTAVPDGSAAVVEDPHAATSAFVPDRAGRYVAMVVEPDDAVHIHDFGRISRASYWRIVESVDST